MGKKIALAVAAGLGGVFAAFAGLSGAFAFLALSGRPAFDDPTIVWFAPLYLTPLAGVGAGLILGSALISRTARRLVAWSAGALAAAFSVTAAAFNLTGLSSGEIPLEGTFWGAAAIAASLAYAATMVWVGGVGFFLARRILWRGPSPHLGPPG